MHDVLVLVAWLTSGTTVMLTPVFITRLIIKHREKLAELKNKQDGSPGLVEAVTELRRELSALRETTTRFDMSFDAALSRVENRLHSVEQGVGTNAHAQSAPYTTVPPVEEYETVSLRR